MNPLPPLAALLLLAALTGPAAAGPKEPVPSLPPPPPENPLSFADGLVVLGIEEQTRFEFRENNYDFNNSLHTVNDDSWLLNRFRISLTLKPADWITLYAQGQDSREFFSDRPNIPGALGAEGDDPFDLHQGWVELGNDRTAFSLKAGRQILSYGDQRLIGAFEWNNFARTFDAVKLRWNGGDGLWVDAFVSSVVVPDRNAFNESDADSLFSGLYAHLPKTGPQDTELYAFWLSDNNRDDDFLTLGTHLKSTPGALGAWDYEGELAWQNGTAGGKDLNAFAVYGEGGYTMDCPWKPRIGLEYSFGSGDSDAADGDQGAFQNLYPTNHPHYGYMDAFSWSNMHDAVLHLSARPAAKLTAGLDTHAFWIAETADTWRRANARSTVRPANNKAGSYAGMEIDALLTYAVNSHVTLTAGYSHFFAGEYLSDTGPADDADFVYLMTGFKF